MSIMAYLNLKFHLPAMQGYVTIEVRSALAAHDNFSSMGSNSLSLGIQMPFLRIASGKESGRCPKF
jgi:hypothetical protein